ncbi:MAG: hypothetical protein JWP76_2352 [Dactylosporangium sp.]|jgi:DNA-binding transcriptional LysR family regulator|nr:hypothetical protein [Dactylosporangium sp.]
MNEPSGTDDPCTVDDLELRELRYFVAVAEELNFTRAADRLGMSQPPLSRAIATLERRLGVALLTRSTRHVTLTEAGRILLEQARPVLYAATAATRRAVRAGRSAPRLVVALKPGADAGLLRDITDRYARFGGRPPVHVAVSGPGEQLPMVRDGRADAALLRGAVDDPAVDVEPLLAEPRMAVLPVTHRHAGSSLLTRADLHGEPVPVWRGANAAQISYQCGLDSTDGPHDTRTLAPPGPEVGGITEVLEVVALGQAVAFLPASTSGRYPRTDVVHVPVADLSPSVLYVAWSRASRSRAVAAFVQAAVEAAAADPQRA